MSDSNLSKFGEITYCYDGLGKLSTKKPDKQFDNCQFEIAQFSNGDIHIMLNANKDLQKLATGETEIIFEGITENNQRIMTSGKVRIIKNGNNGVHFRFASEGSIQVGNPDNDPQSVRFSITNFNFLGTRPVFLTPNHQKLALLDLSLDELEVTIRMLPTYDEIIKKLKNSDGCAITCEMTIPLTSYSLEKVISSASLICDLLSIARGRRINWIAYNLQDNSGNTIFTEHQERITRPYRGIDLIDTIPPENTKHFVEQCYRHCSQPDFRLDLNTIANLNSDVKSQVNFLETRCLILFALLEHLYFALSENRNDKYLKGKIEFIRQQASVPLSDDEIEKCRISRNKMSHEMKFSTEDSQAEYFEILHIFDRILLRLIGYAGYYINATKRNLYRGQNADRLDPSN